MTPQTETPHPRPRVEGDREAEILEAALEVLADVGYDRLTMDAVALRAKASKATLYRRWNGKASLVVDALLHSHLSVPLPEADTGSLRGDLLASFCGVGGLTDHEQLATFGAVLTAIMRDRDFAEAFRREVVGPKTAAARQIFERAQARGEIAPNVDIDLLAPALAGIVLHRLFVAGELPDKKLIARVIDQIILPAATATA